MNTTAAALEWCVDVPQPAMTDRMLDARDSLLRDLQSLVDRVSELGVQHSERDESPEPSSVADYDAVQSQLLGVEMLRELPQGKRLRCPIPLTVHRAPHYFWVTAEGGFLHGVGDSPQAAIEDYGYALLDYYRMLQNEREALAPHLLEHLETLEELIVEE